MANLDAESPGIVADGSAFTMANGRGPPASLVTWTTGQESVHWWKSEDCGTRDFLEQQRVSGSHPLITAVFACRGFVSTDIADRRLSLWRLVQVGLAATKWGVTNPSSGSLCGHSSSSSSLSHPPTLLSKTLSKPQSDPGWVVNN